MASVYEFTISLKDASSGIAEKIASGVTKINDIADKATASVDKMQAKTQSAFSKILSSAKSAIKGPDTLKYSIDELENKLKELNKIKFGTVLKREFDEANKEAKKLEKQISKLKQGTSGTGFGAKMKSWRRDFANSLPGANLISNPLTMAGGAVAGLWSAVEKAMDAGKEKVKMQTLTGSSEIGTQLYNGLTKFATDTVFGNEVYDMGTQMLANGIKSADVMPIMQQLGDISMGNADSLGSLSLAFAQINGKGHLAGQELLQLISAGFNPLQVISEKTGESMESLTKRMEKGEISVSDVRKAMDLATAPGGKFNNMLDKVAKTPYGQLEKLRGQLDQMMVKIGEIFLPIASKLMNFFSWLGEKLGPLLQPLAAVLGGLAVGLLLVAAAQWVANLAFLANPVTWIVAGIIALIAVIIYLISKISGWGNAWKHTVNMAKALWEGYTLLAKSQFNMMIESIMIGIEKIKIGWYKFKNAVGIGNSAENNALIAEANNDIENRKKSIKEGIEKSGKKFIEAINEGKLAADSFKWNKESSLAETTGKLKQTLGLGAATGGGTENSGGGKSLGKTGKEKSDSIISGGSKNMNINITIEKLQDHIIINVDKTEKGLSELGEKVQEILLRAVNSVNQLQTA